MWHPELPRLSGVASADDPEKEDVVWVCPEQLTDGLSCGSLQCQEEVAMWAPRLLPLDLLHLKEEGRR